MFYKKLSLLVLFSLSASHASYATMGHSSRFEEIGEDAMSSTVFHITSKPKAEAAEWRNHLHNLKYLSKLNFINTASKGKRKKEESSSVTTTRPSLRSVLNTFRDNLAISQGEHHKAASYAQAKKLPIAMNIEFMGSGFIFSASGNTALRLSNSNVYLPIYNPGAQRTAVKPLEIDAGIHFAEAKESAFKAVGQTERRNMLKFLGEKFYNKNFFTNN